MKIWLIDSKFDLHRGHLPGPIQHFFKPLSQVKHLFLSVIHKVIFHLGWALIFQIVPHDHFLGPSKLSSCQTL